MYNVQVLAPAEKLLKAQPEWPKFFVTERASETGEHKGTRISVFGYEGGEREYSFEDLRQYIYWNTVVGMTHKLDAFPQVFLKAAARQEEIEVSAIPSFFVAGNFATSDTYLDPEILVLRVLRHRILRRDYR